MIKNYSETKTPTTGKDWLNKSENERIEMLKMAFEKNKLYQDIEILNVPENGQIVLKIEKIIPANERGIFLLNLEEKLKSDIDEGITVWCEPVGDKSKLRKLRGIKIKT